MVRGIVCLKDSGSYTGGALSPDRFNQAGQVSDENPAHGPPIWGLGVGLTTLPRKNKPVMDNYNN